MAAQQPHHHKRRGISRPFDQCCLAHLGLIPSHSQVEAPASAALAARGCSRTARWKPAGGEDSGIGRMATTS